MPNTSEVLKRRDGLHVREIDGETVILDQVKEQMHSLNPTAAFIFEEIDGRRTLNEICLALASSFDVSLEIAERDTRALVDQLRKLDLIT